VLSVEYNESEYEKSIILGVSKKFGKWYQKTNKTEDTNKLTLLAFMMVFRRGNIKKSTVLP
jgi:hypothetical protein